MSAVYLSTKSEDDNSDTLSSNGTKSTEESSPYFTQLSEVCDMDSVSNPTKKIRKKRCSYDKIDDEKRVRLLEAVQNGESLKCASQRLQINYSSAKSILHTFRKEGRILKKSPIESSNRPTINLQGNYMAGPVISEQGSSGFNNDANCPMKGLTSIFANLAIDAEDDQETGIMNALKQEVQRKEEDTAEFPELQIPNFMSEFSVNFSIGGPALEAQMSRISGILEMRTDEEPAYQMISLPTELVQPLDNFYMRYSNSPLSGGKGLFKESSDCGSRRYCGEFESFSEVMNTLYTLVPGEEAKNEFGVPSFERFSSSGSAQEKRELMLFKQNSIESGFMRMNGELESYLSGDSQWLMCNALKASFFNNLIELKRSGSSMRSEH